MGADILAKGLIVIAIVFMVVGFLYPGEQTGWDNFNTSMQSFPSFNDPFNQISTLTAFPTYPVLTDDNGAPGNQNPTMFGCNETLSERANCINTPDGESSYVQFNQTAAQYISWNWSRADLPIIDDSLIRYVQITMSCRTVNGSAFQFYMAWAWNAPTIFQNTCPVSNTYVNVIVRLDTPSGYVQDLFASNPNAMAHMQPYWNNGTTMNARFTFLKLELGIIGVQAATCQAPDGAWFPAVDEIACAITQFGMNLVKYLQFFVNGVIYAGQVVAYGVGVFIALMVVVAFFFTVPNAPDVVRGILAAFFIGYVFLIVITIAGLIRGTGTGLD